MSAKKHIESKPVLDFAGKDFFLGVDVHLKQWTVTIRLEQMELRTFSMDPSPDQLASFMHKYYPDGTYHSVYEAGFSGFWAHHQLLEAGFDNIVVHPNDVPTSDKEKTGKSDVVDSRKLARELEKHSLTGIFIPTVEQQQFRSLVRSRWQIVQSRTRTKNRIKSFLYLYGITIPARFKGCCWSRNFISWLGNIPFDYKSGQQTMQRYVDELNFHRQQLLEVTRQMRQYVRQDPHRDIIRRLKTVPGIGPIVAMHLYAELMDMNRFPNLNHLAANVGLVPSIERSDEQERVKGVTYRHNHHLRPILVEAAWVAIRKDPALTQIYHKLCQRMKRQQAIIRIAKKLLNRIRHVWKYEEDYVLGVMS